MKDDDENEYLSGPMGGVSRFGNNENASQMLESDK